MNDPSNVEGDATIAGMVAGVAVAVAALAEALHKSGLIDAGMFARSLRLAGNGVTVEATKLMLADIADLVTRAVEMPIEGCGGNLRPVD